MKEKTEGYYHSGTPSTRGDGEKTERTLSLELCGKVGLGKGDPGSTRFTVPTKVLVNKGWLAGIVRSQSYIQKIHRDVLFHLPESASSY